MTTLAEEVKAYKASPNKEAQAQAQSTPASAAPTAAKPAPVPTPTPTPTAASPISQAAAKAAIIGGPGIETPVTPATPTESQKSQMPVTPSAPAPQGEPVNAAPATPGPSTSSENSKPLLTHGDKVFKTPEELVSYIAQLERDKATREAYEQGRQASQPAAPTEPEVKLEELIFEDPARALAIIREAAVREVRQEFAARDTRETQAKHIKSTWDRFYEANPRLKDFPEITQTALNEVIAERGENIDMEQGLKLVAQRALHRLDVYRDKLTPAAREETLSNAPAQVATGGLAPTPAAPAAPILTFTDQVRSLRKKGA